MSTWEFNEVRQAIEDTFRTHVTDAEARAIAEIAVGVFQSFTSGYDLIETTQLGSVDETAIKQRYIDARIYYGGVESLRRARRTGGDGWEPYVPEGETGQFIERGERG